MAKVLIISGHPNLKVSVANKAILEALEKVFPDAEIRKLDELYPNYKIEVAAEQAALEKADVIIFQFPFMWYSAPALLKLYIEEVFLQGWAYGLNVETLKDKKLIISFTTGAPEKFYKKDSILKHEPPEFNYCLEMVASRCHMKLQPMIYNCAMSYMGGSEELKKTIIAKALSQVKLIINAVKN